VLLQNSVEGKLAGTFTRGEVNAVIKTADSHQRQTAETCVDCVTSGSKSFQTIFSVWAAARRLLLLFPVAKGILKINLE